MIRATVVAAVTCAALSACGAPSPATPQLSVPPASEQASAPGTPSAAPLPRGNLSERGNVVKKPGETAAFGPTQDNLVVTFAIDKITVDPTCTSQFASEPDHGHFLKVDVRAETKPTMPADAFYSINPFEFSVVGADGITESAIMTGAAVGCLDPAEQLPSGQFSPGSKYRGSLVLDTKNPSGVLVFKPGFMATTGGWEWTYGK